MVALAVLAVLAVVVYVAVVALAIRRQNRRPAGRDVIDLSEGGSRLKDAGQNDTATTAPSVTPQARPVKRGG
jgi:hypothetical protein